MSPAHHGGLVPALWELMMADFKYTLIGTLLLAVGLRLLAGWIRQNFFHGLPPGPVGVPLLGYIPFMSESQHVTLVELRQKFGPVYSLPIGRDRFLVLNDYKSIREFFMREAANGRPKLSMFETLLGVKSFTDLNGETWREQKRFMLRTLRDLGLGQAAMAAHMHHEISIVLREISARSGSCRPGHGEGVPVDITRILLPATANMIHAMVFGRRMKTSEAAAAASQGGDSNEQAFLLRELERTQRGLNNLNIYAAYPRLISLLARLRLFRFNEALEAARDLGKYFAKEIIEHDRSLDESNPKSYIDMFLVEMRSRRRKAGLSTQISADAFMGSDDEYHKWDSSTGSFNEAILLGNVFTFFLAGSDTSMIATTWCLCLMAAHPEIQRRVHNEIALVFEDSSDGVTLEHRSRLPYCMAVVAEMHRWRSFVPTSVNRSLLTDTSIETAGGRQYSLPAGTIVVANLWAAHHDPEVWTDPLEFRPERFLRRKEYTGDGGPVEWTFKSREELIPFSTGKRSCPGEGMAQAEVFTLFVSIMRAFRVTLPEGVSADRILEPLNGLVTPPRDARLVFHSLTS